MKKRKHYWRLQVFREGEVVLSQYLAHISQRPAQPWFGDEVWKWDHEISLTLHGWAEFKGCVPRITMLDGDGNSVEEWDLLGVKVKNQRYGEQGGDELCEINLTYEDTKYQAYDCVKCHGQGGYSLPNDDQWYTCWDCMGRGTNGVRGKL